MADEQHLPGNAVSRVEVELMIERGLQPIHQTLTEMRVHNLSLYGNGSGRAGYLENMEARQEVRWENQTIVNQKMSTDLAKISASLKSGAAVARDRKWLITTAIMAVPVALDIYLKLHGR